MHELICKKPPADDILSVQVGSLKNGGASVSLRALVVAIRRARTADFIILCILNIILCKASFK